MAEKRAWPCLKKMRKITLLLIGLSCIPVLCFYSVKRAGCIFDAGFLLQGIALIILLLGLFAGWFKTAGHKLPYFTMFFLFSGAVMHLASYSFLK